MLCEKCHTATDAGDATCNTCGTRIKKRNRTRARIVRVVVVILILAAFGTYFTLQHFDIIDFDPFENLFGGGTSTSVEESTPPIGTDSEDANHVNVSGGNAEAPPDRRRSDGEHQAMLTTHLAAVTAYVNLHVQTNILLTRTGFLYNATTSEVVDTPLLISLGFLEDAFAYENVMVLYLRPKDLADYDEVEFPPLSPTDREVLTVFLAYQTPIGLGLYSTHGGTVIFRESLNEVLMYYSPDNGEVFRPTMADAIYHYVAEMIAELRFNSEEQEQGQEQIFIRHLAVDDAHGFVAFSVASDINTISNIIFSIDLDEDYYTVLNIITAAAFEVTRMPTMVINSVAPGFNFELMPLYDIAPVNIHLMDEDEPMFIDLLTTLTDINFSNALFVSASYPFAHVVTTTGQVFMGFYDDGWRISGVATWHTIEDVIAASAGVHPFYILWQQ